MTSSTFHLYSEIRRAKWQSCSSLYVSIQILNLHKAKQKLECYQKIVTYREIGMKWKL